MTDNPRCQYEDLHESQWEIAEGEQEPDSLDKCAYCGGPKENPDSIYCSAKCRRADEFGEEEDRG